MKASHWIVVVSACLLESFRAAGAAPPPAGQQTSLRQLQTALDAYNAGDCAPTEQTIPSLVAKRSGLSDEILALGYDILVRCELASKKYEAAYSHLTEVTKLQSATDDLWLMRWAMEIWLKKSEAAVSTLETLSTSRGSAVARVPADQLFDLYRAVKSAGSDALIERFLKSVIAPNFIPADLFWTPDNFILDLANLLSKQGRKEEAEALISRIDSPNTLVDAWLDIRFRAVATKALDARTVLERKLAHDQRIAQAHPEALEGYLQVARELGGLGRNDEALATLDSALTKTGLLRNFSDLDSQLNWYWNERAKVLDHIGREDDALASMRRGHVARERGGLNVSQVINLAEMQVSFGRGADALETIQLFEASKRPVSGYGELALRLERVCAYNLTGQLEKAADDVAFAKAHEADGPYVAIDLLICANDVDGAADILVRMLDDPDQRAAALRQLSDFEPSGVKRRSFWEESGISTRPDILSAVARAGGTGKFNFSGGDFY